MAGEVRSIAGENYGNHRGFYGANQYVQRFPVHYHKFVLGFERRNIERAIKGITMMFSFLKRSHVIEIPRLPAEDVLDRALQKKEMADTKFHETTSYVGDTIIDCFVHDMIHPRKK